MKKSRVTNFVLISWISAVSAITALSIELFIRAPAANDPFTAASAEPSPFTTISPQCCISTRFDEESALQTLVLGFSLNNTGKIPPPSYAFLTSNISSDLYNAISKYFTIIRTNEKAQYLDLNYWTLKQCSPVVAVSHTGIFNKDPLRICNAKPFAAVPRQGDIVYFDTSLIVLDPLKPPNLTSNDIKPDRLLNSYFLDWNVLPTDLSVEDFNNEYLDFWLKFSSPTFLHFSDQTFSSAVNDKSSADGSKMLFEIVRRTVKEAKAAHKEVFDNYLAK